MFNDDFVLNIIPLLNQQHFCGRYFSVRDADANDHFVK